MSERRSDASRGRYRLLPRSRYVLGDLNSGEAEHVNRLAIHGTYTYHLGKESPEASCSDESERHGFGMQHVQQRAELPSCRETSSPTREGLFPEIGTSAQA
jgi:hypothetical protein